MKSNLMPHSLVLFDLDGTIIDSQSGIVASLRQSLNELGVDVHDNHDFRWCIGSSLWDIYSHYLDTTDKSQLNAAVDLYREIYRTGPMFDYRTYDGIEAALQELVNQGYRLVLATAKAREYAQQVVEASSFSTLLHAVYGSELDGTNVRKEDLIAHVLQCESMHPSQAVMIGDRHHDINGAVANRVQSIGVSYGYGRVEEFAAATAIVHAPHELPSAITTILPHRH